MPLLVTLQWSRLAVLAETPAARCPPCLHGLTSAALPQWSHICRHASLVTHLPPCLHGLTSARHTSLVTHSPPCLNGHTFAAMPRWSHLCRRASMVSHLPALPQWSHICPPCLIGYTSARHASMVTHLPAMPQWSHNTLHTSRADQLPRHHIRTPKAAFLRSRCSPWDLLRAFRVLSSSEPRSAVVAFMRG